jgi:hypothetical protein
VSPPAAEGAPALSVVLPVPVRHELVRRTIRHLAAQTIAHRLELLLVTPRGTAGGAERSELGAFADARVVEVPSGTTLTECRVAGARVARAPIVAFAEDHSYPMSQWAESLLRAHAGGFDAVAPSFRNGNPATMLSWADITLAFGSWVAPVPGGDVMRLPWHNTSYKRDLLLAFGDRLAEVLEVESVLQEELRARGHRLYLDTAIYTEHVNFSRLRPFVEEYYVSGRLFGARRAQAQRWSVARRAVYAVGSPLIPVKRLPEVVRQLRRVGRGALLPRIVPALVVGLAAHSLGEMVGYVLGAGNAGEQKSAREFDRARFVVPSDLPTLAPP